jgi:hypothetical protein
MTAKISVKDWRNLPVDNWTVTTFRQYLADKHEQHYGIKYTARNYAVEGRWLKSMVAEHGAEVVKAFIDGCLKEYRPTQDYPGINFAFMFSYQRSRILPRVMAEVKRKQGVQRAVEETEDLSDWL